MKKILQLLAVALVAVGLAAVDCRAQLGNPGTPFSAVTINGTATSTTTAMVNVATAAKIGVQLVSVSDAANVSNTTVIIDRSLDKSNWLTAYQTITLANTGTTTVKCISNFTGQADTWWRITASNSALTGVTNTISVSVQILKQ